MNLSQITTTDLSAIGKLLQRKESLQAEVAKIDGQLDSYGSGKLVKQVAGKVSLVKLQKAASKKRSPRSKKGSIREGVNNVLKNAGKAGMHISKIAEGMGGNLGSLRQWFATSGKKIKNIKRVGPATYRLES